MGINNYELAELFLSPRPVLSEEPWLTCACVLIHHLADDADGLCNFLGEAVGILQILHQHLLLHQLIVPLGSFRFGCTGSVFTVS